MISYSQASHRDCEKYIIALSTVARKKGVSGPAKEALVKGFGVTRQYAGNNFGRNTQVVTMNLECLIF